MLSCDKEKLNTPEANANRFTVRLRFVKTGNLQYISHLDLQRTFNRVIKRSGIPVWYTQGFNPHMKLVFSSPLSIGTESVCEYLDLSMDGIISCGEIMERLNRELTDELRITAAYIPTRKFAEIKWAEYSYEFLCDGLTADTADSVNSLLSTSPINMIKSTKSGEKEIDIVGLIDKARAEYDTERGVLKLFARLCAEPTQFLNPEMVVTALKERLGMMSGDPTRQTYSILRCRLLDAQMREFE